MRSALLLATLLLAACHSSQPAAQPRPKPAPPPRPTQPAPVAQDNRPTLPFKSDATTVQWVDSERLMPVLEEAQRLHKPVFVEFHASWCAPCKVLEEEIFTQTAVYEGLNSGFVNFRTDFDSPAGQTLAGLYEVKSLPTLLFLDPQGVVLQRHVGLASAAQLKALMQAASRQ